MASEYDDIIDLAHHVSATRPHMTMRDRAAQFSPFAALTGYGDAVRETARLTDGRIELDESKKTALGFRLRSVAENLARRPRVELTYFLPDGRKAGGAYVMVSGEVKTVDETQRAVVMCDGTRVPIDEIIDVEGELFSGRQYG